MKKLFAAVAALTLLIAPAVAADRTSLSPGKAAGIKKAQDADNSTVLYVIGGGALVAGIIVLATNDNSAPPAPQTITTTTST